MRQLRAVSGVSCSPSRISRAALAACAVIFAAGAGSAFAAPFSAGGGFDYYAGPADQITRSALAIASVGFGPVGNATVVGLRYDDSQIGEGAGIAGGVGLPIMPLSTMQVWGYRYVGDEAFRGWRVKAGPRFGFPGGSNLGIYYAHFEDNQDSKSDGGIAELGVPLVGGLSGRASAAFASAPGDLKSTQGSLGLSWSAARFLELSGDVGLAHNGAITTAPFPSRRGLDLPIIGGGSPGTTTSESSSTESTYQLGVRLMFP